MRVERRIDLLRGQEFFSSALPIYVNRVVESYDLHEHRHDFLEISYVSEGSGTHIMGESSLPVNQGDIFWLPVGTSHVFRPASLSRQQPLIVYNCILSIEAVVSTLKSFPGGEPLLAMLSNQEFRHYKDPYGEFQRMFQRLHYEYNTIRSGREIAIYTDVIQLLLFLHRLDAEPQDGAAPLSIRLEAVLNELHARFHSRITVKEMALKTGVSQRQFLRLFSRQTGMTMSDYLQAIRISEACELLRTTDRKVSDIASAVGYQDISHFYAIFKKKTGVAPRSFRRPI
ncbi:MAG: AraC family transcriptional regulator [Paenibacillus sp.]|nr:AraC family transcriptional regulator [Paenibacillus sp.]